eukprot:GAFH01001597.1.p1 GENE.GAFH01001597.1~~GAFH01001597.1.p1  ORF type:complete len:360 (-),score=104.41 GAFH01001597.1:171-1250(-)
MAPSRAGWCWCSSLPVRTLGAWTEPWWWSFGKVPSAKSTSLLELWPLPWALLAQGGICLFAFVFAWVVEGLLYGRRSVQHLRCETADETEFRVMEEQQFVQADQSNMPDPVTSSSAYGAFPGLAAPLISDSVNGDMHSPGAGGAAGGAQGAQCCSKFWLRLFNGWNDWFGAAGLILVQLLLIVVVGGLWGISGVFALWGSKLLYLMGVPVDQWDYWKGSPALASPFFANMVTDLNLSIILGATFGTMLSRQWCQPSNPFAMPWRHWISHILGGLLLGYGSRIAHGCNIGAYFSGTASLSLHGWLWLVAALLGNWLADRLLRPLFRLHVDRLEKGQAGSMCSGCAPKKAEPSPYNGVTEI